MNTGVNVNTIFSHGRASHGHNTPHGNVHAQSCSVVGMGQMLFRNNNPAVLNAKLRVPERIDPFPRNPGGVANLSEEDLMRSPFDRKSSRREVMVSLGNEGTAISPMKAHIVEQSDDD